MENKVSELQKKINNIAAQKLNQDLSKFITSIKQNELFRCLDDFVVKFPAYYDKRGGQWAGAGERGILKLMDGNSSIGSDLIFDKMIPVYIQRETEIFLDKVNKIKQSEDK